MMIHSAIWSEQGVAFFNTNPGKKGSLIHRNFSASLSTQLVYVCSKLQKKREQNKFFIFAGQLLF
jgi:hypothetical protein